MRISASATASPVHPSNAETAKTIVSTVNHGTLSTLSEDGTPLGTYVAFVLDDKVCNKIVRSFIEFCRSRAVLF